MTSVCNTHEDSSSSDDSECEPLWDSTDESDSDNLLPPKKREKLSTKKEEGESVEFVPEVAVETITVTVDEDGTARSKLFSMDENPVCDVESEVDDRDPYEVRRFSNFRDVITYMGHYEQETLTHFTSLSRNGKFGEEKRIPNVHRGRIYFESLKGKCGMPITYDGVPFLHVGRWSFGCHQGVDRNQKQKQLYQQKRKERCRKEGIKLETRQRTTKKVNCPAEIYISHVVKFPQHQVPESVVATNCLPSDQVRRSIKRKLSEQYKQHPESIACQHWYYVRIPHPWAHKGHPVMATLTTPDTGEIPAGTKVTLNAQAVARMYDKRKTTVEGIVMRTKEPVDERVLDKIREVYKAGVQQEKEIRALVGQYVREDIFTGKAVPPSIFRRYNPTHKDIANEITKAREELRVERVRSQREVCGSLVSEVAHLVPAVEDEDVLQQMQETLAQLYEIVKAAVPACISNPIDNVVTETTIDDKEESSCSTGLLLSSDQAGLLMPQTIAVPVPHLLEHANTNTVVQQQHHHQQQQQQHHQQQQQQQHHQPQQQQHHHQQQSQQQAHHHQQPQQHTITYHNYTVHPINTINTLNTINGSTGAGTIHTINTSPNTINTIHPHQQTYEIANIQPRTSGQFETHFREAKLTPWYQ